MMTAKGSRGLESCGFEAGPQVKRRSWRVAERQRIVEAALAPGASVAAVARAHDVNANLVFKWIRRSREGWRDRRCGAGKRALRLSPRADEAPPFVPVRLVAPEPAALRDAAVEKGGAPTPQRDPPSAARLAAMEIRLPNGAQVRIEEGADREVLRLVLSTLSGL
jgi:transposase